MSTGMNVKNVRVRNKSLILHLINENGDMSRKTIAKKTGLTPAAVTKLTAELIEEGLISENGKYQADRSGRKEVSLTLRLEQHCVLGINAERDSITYSISDMAGNLKAIWVTDFTDDVDEVARRAASFFEENPADIDAIGVCVIGTRSKDYSVWDAPKLIRLLENRFAKRVIVKNNVKAFALAQLLYGKVKNATSVLFLKWGPGVGSSIVTHGRVFSGGDNGITEIGHYIVKPNGAKCRCSRRGCLETEVAFDRIVEELEKGGLSLTHDELIGSDDERVKTVFEEKSTLVAMSLINTATILNANEIVLFGSVFERKGVDEMLKRHIKDLFENFDENTVSVSALNDKRNYIGTVAVCASELFFYDEN